MIVVYKQEFTAVSIVFNPLVI